MAIGQPVTPQRETVQKSARDQQRSLAPRDNVTLVAPSLFTLHDGFSVLVSLRVRLVLVAFVVLTLILFGLGVLTDSRGLQSSTATIFLLIELGIAPTLLFRHISALWFALIALSLSVSGTIAIGFIMAVFHIWHPSIAMGLVVIATSAMLAVSVSRDLPQLRADRTNRVSVVVTRPSLSSTARVNLLSVLGLGIVVLVAVTNQMNPQPGGLFSTINPLWYLGLLVIVASVVMAGISRASAAVPVLMLSGVVVLSQSIVYGSPAVMSAARHVGIIDYVRIHQGLDRSLDIYQAWSGMFAGMAWLSDVANIANVMTVATWWPVLLSPATALALALLASRFLKSGLRIWMAAAIFTLTSTLNIVYFSPQSVGLLLAIVIMALAVSPRRQPGTRSPVGSARVVLILIFSMVMAVSHQISPYLTVAALVAMLIFGYLRPWWISLVVLAPAVLWAVANTAVLGHFLSIGALGALLSNVKPPTQSFAQLPTPFIATATFNIPAAVLVLVGLAAGATILILRTRVSWALGFAAVSAISLIAATNYGQEGIFRVTLFAGIWLSILAAGLPVRATPFTIPALAASLALLLGINAFGQTALDWNRVVTKDSAIATQTYESIAPDHSLLLLTGTPKASPLAISGRYLDVGYLSRESLGGYPSPLIAYDPAADLARLTTNLVRYSPATGYYALVSTSIGAYDERYGFQSYADYQELAATMAVSPLWHPIRKGATSTLYEITNAGLALGGR